jgi:putative acetyltransferase
MTRSGPPRLAPFEPHLGPGVVDLISAVYAEYAMTFDPAFEADLDDVGAAYLARGGMFAVLVDGDRVVGTVGALAKDGGACELKRVYLHPAHRGRGHGRRLIEHGRRWAEARGHRVLLAWSDVRLVTAHAVYRHLGFEPAGERTLDDPDRSREVGFRLALRGGGRPGRN